MSPEGLVRCSLSPFSRSVHYSAYHTSCVRQNKRKISLGRDVLMTQNADPVSEQICPYPSFMFASATKLKLSDEVEITALPPSPGLVKR